MKGSSGKSAIGPSQKIHSLDLTSLHHLRADTDHRGRLASRGNISKPITGETTYTLSCIALNGGTTLTKQATVRIIPTFQEK